MELEDLDRNGTRPRTGYLSRTERRLKSGDNGKKVYSWEVKLKEQNWSKIELFKTRLNVLSHFRELYGAA